MAAASRLAVRQDGVFLRQAVVADVPAIVALLADDPIGSAREAADLDAYPSAFAAVDADPGELSSSGSSWRCDRPAQWCR